MCRYQKLSSKIEKHPFSNLSGYFWSVVSVLKRDNYFFKEELLSCELLKKSSNENHSVK